MRVLVTGAGGFVGKYLIELLMEHRHDVIAMGLGKNQFKNIENIVEYDVNVLDYDAVFKCINFEKPDAVIHLAAVSNIPISWSNPALTANVNIIGTINVLQALIKTNSNAKFLNVGSSDEYGLAAAIGKPITEDIICQPQNPYAVSKYAAEQIVLQIAKKNNTQLIHVRPFNHFGPGQAKGFVTTDFAYQIANIEKNRQKAVIYVGDLEAYRDFLFVTDVVRAYVKIIEENVPSGVYNICSGRARKIKNILEILVSYSNTKISIENDPLRMRPSDVPFFVGNCDKLRKNIVWEPKYNFKQGLREVLDYWRENS